MKKFYWFGGSWVRGDELDKSIPVEKVHQNTFPYLVSEHYSAQCINMAENGSSVDTVLVNFSKIIDQADTDATMFFCLPPLHRTSFFNDQGIQKNILPSGPANSNRYHNRHEYSTMWYKYFDSESQQIYNRDRTINLLHLWCKDLKIRHYFFNDTSSTQKTMMDITPDSVWLVPRDMCNGQLILPGIDPKTRDIVMHDNADLPEEIWVKQQPFFEQYIKPNYCHPNVAGHKKIAQELIKLLDNE